MRLADPPLVLRVQPVVEEGRFQERRLHRMRLDPARRIADIVNGRKAKIVLHERAPLRHWL